MVPPRGPAGVTKNRKDNDQRLQRPRIRDSNDSAPRELLASVPPERGCSTKYRVDGILRRCSADERVCSRYVDQVGTPARPQEAEPPRLHVTNGSSSLLARGTKICRTSKCAGFLLVYVHIYTASIMGGVRSRELYCSPATSCQARVSTSTLTEPKTPTLAWLIGLSESN